MRSGISVILFLITLNVWGFTQESFIDSTKIKDPKLAWKLGIIPGLGQAYNERWIKAAAVVGTQYYATSKYMEHRDAGHIEKRNTYAWWMLGLFIYSMLDSYVDAQLSTFPVKIEPQDTTNTDSELLKPKESPNN